MSDHLWGALGIVAERWRLENPEMAARVDEIKADPNRRASPAPRGLSAVRTRECEWCGDDFPLYSKHEKTCTAQCRTELAAWRKKRRQSL